MSDAPPKLLPHYQHQPAQVKKQVLQGKNCFAILSFPRRSLCSDFAEMVLNSRSHLYSIRVRGIQSPDPQEGPSTAALQTHRKPSTASEI